jgi:phenylacetic acid degradation protein
MRQRANMTKVYSIDGITPVVHPEAYVHPSAVLIGDVIVGAGVYVGPCASLRGDFGRIVIGSGANVQDSCIVHGAPGGDTVIEEDGHIGHGAIIHAARICRNAMIGMHAVINDRAEIGESAFVGALAFVKTGMKVPPRMLAVGMPARVLRSLSDDELQWKHDATRQYQQLTERSRASLRETVALTDAEPDRRRIELPDVLPLGAYKQGVAEQRAGKDPAE